MRRIIGYAHGPAPYVPPAVHVVLPPETLAALAGHYTGSRIPDIVVAVHDDGLTLTAGDLVLTLHAATATRFFALERDLQFEFATVPGQPDARTLTVYEHGTVAETAARKD